MSRSMSRRRPWPLMILLAMFLTPFLAALYLLQFKDHSSFNSVQYGNLIQPAQQINLSLSSNKWQVIYLNSSSCNTECQTKQQTLSNLHRALGADQDRVIFSVKDHEMINVDAKDDSILIVNPQGLYIMHYPPGAKLSGLLKDLKRLLKYSHAT